MRRRRPWWSWSWRGQLDAFAQGVLGVVLGVCIVCAGVIAIGVTITLIEAALAWLASPT